MPAVSIEHYENFPVASWLCPPPMRGAVVAIYHFARTADDLADEGTAAPAERRQSLACFRQALLQSLRQTPDPSSWPQVFVPLSQAIARHDLPTQPLHDLLDAFEQDTSNPRYADRTALLDYCRRSANPIGRLMLHLAGVSDEKSLAQSDAICTALQLINFWQDPSVDLPRGRHYVPEADAKIHGLALESLETQVDSVESQALLRDLCQWAATLMLHGAPLACQVSGRLGWELRFVVQGGLRILERIGQMRYRTLRHRPVLGPTDAPVLAWRALRMRVDFPAPGFKLP